MQKDVFYILKKVQQTFQVIQISQLEKTDWKKAENRVNKILKEIPVLTEVLYLQLTKTRKKVMFTLIPTIHFW